MARRQSSKKASAGTAEGANCSGSLDAFRKSDIAAGLGRQLDKLAAASLASGLYLVSTPIGHLGDISVRALFTLAAADIVLCEDTRHSRKLFSAYGLHNRLAAYHDFSGDEDRARVIALLGEGKAVALISDAGTPLVSDPGFKLVRAAIDEGFPVFAVPGASAVLTSLVASGLPSDQFFFGGFLPPKEAARRDALDALLFVPGTLIFYETGTRLQGTLAALAAIFPGRAITLARELTKFYEAFHRGTAVQLLEDFKKNPPLGELVLLIAPGERPPPTGEEIERALRKAMQAGSLKEAVEEVARGLGAGKKMVYNLALKLKDHAT